MNNSTFGIHFVLRTNKIFNGLAPIYTRITVDSKRCEISVKGRFPKISATQNYAKVIVKKVGDDMSKLKEKLSIIRAM